MTPLGRGDTGTDTPQGVEPLDHTAGVGYDVTAGSLEELIERAAVGAEWLALGCLPPEGSEERSFVLENENLAGLTRAWLREVLYRQEVEGFAPGAVSAIEIEPEGRRLEARVLGGPSLGTVGSGNHFVEIGWVDEVHDAAAPEAMGLHEGVVTVFIHSGSTGLGYQVCDDYLDVMLKAAERYGIDLPDRRYRSMGQPVLIPGDMVPYSYVLLGTEGASRETFSSTCHGAGRLLSRRRSRRQARGRDLIREFAERGIQVRASSGETVAEEVPEAYRDVADVVRVVDGAGLGRKVVRLRGVLKG